MPEIVEAPGESLDTFDFTIAFLRAYEKVRPELTGLADQYTGHDNVPGNDAPIPGDRLIDKFKRAYGRFAQSPANTGRYAGLNFEEALKKQFELPLPVATNPTKAPTPFTGARLTVENHLSGLKDGTVAPDTPLWLNIATAAAYQGSFGFEAANMKTATGAAATTPLPSRQSGRFHVYTEVMRWAYAKKYEGFHKHLLDRGLPIGQRPDDIEGDPLIPLIPMYFNYEDSFMEAYGGPERMKELPEGNRFLVTTSHPVHRAHSTMCESPLMRELTHRVRGGGEYSGNDWGTYALSAPDKNGRIPRPGSAIDVSGGKTDFKRASWIQVWMNVKDGERLGIKDGDIIEMRNPVGAVRVAVKLTRRAAKGYIALNQGGWYAPDPVDGVDDGGCANTLMCTRGSRLDHGNGAQSAMVTIKKVF
jgi:anaerobic selenocysteine-containing dehydrogenase